MGQVSYYFRRSYAFFRLMQGLCSLEPTVTYSPSLWSEDLPSSKIEVPPDRQTGYEGDTA